MVYGVILKKGEQFYTRLGRIFAAIGEAQTGYNWLITNCECYPQTPDTAALLSGEFCWLSGDELTSIVRKEDFQWVWGVLSGFEPDTPLEDVLKYPLPYADGYVGFWENPLSIQHPLASVEIVAWDSSLTLVFSRRREIIDSFRKFFSMSEDLTLYNERWKADAVEKAILYIHGKGGSAAEAEQYRTACAGFDVIGVDYDGYYPWTAQNQIRAAYDVAREKYASIFVLANSIGAYFTMHTLQGCEIERALFISPVPDMERLIFDMMNRAGVTEQELREKGEIPADFGETLSWEYLRYVRENQIDWKVRTEILYAGGDNLISREMVDTFARTHNASLTVMENGEHWFHTQEQMDFLYGWLRKVL